jgi:hypothetical protein
VTNLATKDERQETKVMQGLNGNHMIMVAVACAIALALTMAMSRAVSAMASEIRRPAE